LKAAVELCSSYRGVFNACRNKVSGPSWIASTYSVVHELLSDWNLCAAIVCESCLMLYQTVVNAATTGRDTRAVLKNIGGATFRHRLQSFHPNAKIIRAQV
jgi:hypothetical protein